MHTLGYSLWPGSKPRQSPTGSDSQLHPRNGGGYGVAEKIRCGHRVLAAAWSSAEARWTVSAERTFGLHPAVPGRVPRQGSRKPWKLGQTYAHDILALRCERSKTA